MNLDKFDGKVGEWDNWYHQFEFLATHYNWDDRERLVRLVSCLRGPALTGHRSFSQIARNTYAHCIAAPPGEIWEQETRPNHNTSGRTVHRATGRGGEYGNVWMSGLRPDQPSLSRLSKRSYPTLKPCGTCISKGT